MKSSFPIAACTPLDRYHDLVRIGQVAEPQMKDCIRLTYSMSRERMERFIGRKMSKLAIWLH